MKWQTIMTSILALGLAVPAMATGEADPTGAITDQHLAIFDIDGDGAVSRTEYRVTTSNAFVLMEMDGANALSPAEAKDISAAMIKGMDAEADGMASRVEYDMQVLDNFDAADLDGNGILN